MGGARVEQAEDGPLGDVEGGAARAQVEALDVVRGAAAGLGGPGQRAEGGARHPRRVAEDEDGAGVGELKLPRPAEQVGLEHAGAREATGGGEVLGVEFEAPQRRAGPALGGGLEEGARAAGGLHDRGGLHVGDGRHHLPGERERGLPVAAGDAGGVSGHAPL